MLRVKVLRGINLRSVQYVLPQDPYVECVVLQGDDARRAEEARTRRPAGPTTTTTTTTSSPTLFSRALNFAAGGGYNGRRKTSSAEEGLTTIESDDGAEDAFFTSGSEELSPPPPTTTTTTTANRRNRQRTKTVVGGGRNPKWTSKNEMRFVIFDPQSVAVITVWDRELSKKSREIGETRLNLVEFDEDGLDEMIMVVDLAHRGEFAGRLEIQITYEPPVVVQPPPPPPPPPAEPSPLAGRHPPPPARLSISSSPRNTNVGGGGGRRWFNFEDAAAGSAESERCEADALAANKKRRMSCPWRDFPCRIFAMLLALLLVAFSVLPLMLHVLSYPLGYVVYPVFLVLLLPYLVNLFLPRALAKIGNACLKAFVPGRIVITFGAIHISFWLRNFTELSIRVTVEDFAMSNPPRQRYDLNFITASKVEAVGTVKIRHIWNLVTLRLERVPLKKIPDFRRWIEFDVRRLEVSDFSLDFEVSKATGRLNVNEITRCFAAGEVRAFLKKQAYFRAKEREQKRRETGQHRPASRDEFDAWTDAEEEEEPGAPPRYFWPNSLEIQVLRARNLPAKDANGLSDPFIVVHVRRMKRRTKVMRKTLNPMYEKETFQFPLTDPSAVIHIVAWDEDLYKPADFLGQWIMTTKWLLLDPWHCRHSGDLRVERDQHPRDEEEENSSPFREEFHEGWVTGWFPLVDERWQESSAGRLGEINLRLRWRFDPALHTSGAGEEDELGEGGVGGERLDRVCTQRPLDQIADNQKETRVRLGDLHAVIDMLNHVPVLFDIHLVMIRDAKVSVADLFKARSRATAAVEEVEQLVTRAATGVRIGGANRARAAAKAIVARARGTVVAATSANETGIEATVTRGASSGDAATSDVSSRRGKRGAAPRRTSREAGEEETEEEAEDDDEATPGWENDDFAAGEGNPRRETERTEVEREDEVGDDADEDEDDEDDFDADAEDEIVQVQGHSKRPFVRIPTIEWSRQFRPRHGDPGITTYKVLDRFFRGLAPKLARHRRLNMKLLGQTSSGFFFSFWQDFTSARTWMERGDAIVSSLAAAPRAVGSRVVETTKLLKGMVVNHTTMEELFVAGAVARNARAEHQQQQLLQQNGQHAARVGGEAPGGGLSDPFGVIRGFEDATGAGAGGGALVYPAGAVGSSQAAAAHLPPILRIHADCDDYLNGEIRLSGRVRVCWSGKHLPERAHAGYRWFGADRTPWHVWEMQVRGTTVFFRKVPHTPPSASTTTSGGGGGGGKFGTAATGAAASKFRILNIYDATSILMSETPIVVPGADHHSSMEHSVLPPPPPQPPPPSSPPSRPASSSTSPGVPVRKLSSMVFGKVSLFNNNALGGTHSSGTEKNLVGLDGEDDKTSASDERRGAEGHVEISIHFPSGAVMHLASMSSAPETPKSPPSTSGISSLLRKRDSTTSSSSSNGVSSVTAELLRKSAAAAATTAAEKSWPTASEWHEMFKELRMSRMEENL